MPFNGRKNYTCDVQTCRQSFSTADKLNTHRRIHKVTPLVFPPSDNGRTSPQGPQPDDTPARFTKLMDAAGLVQDLSNPFDASFRKAGENPPSLHMIDSEMSAANVMPPTTADILQQVVEQEQPPWKGSEGGDLRAPVITPRPGNLSTLPDQNPQSISLGNSSIIQGVTIKSSGSPPPSIEHMANQSGAGIDFNHVIMKPMIGLIQQANSTLSSSRPHFQPHFTAQPISSGLELSVSEQHAERVSMKRKSHGSSDDEEERKRKFRENNKLAAQRCRQRKKQEIEDTRKERDRLREENQKLGAKLELCLQNDEKLRDQVEKLKIELAEHAQCNVSLKKRGVIQYPGL